MPQRLLGAFPPADERTWRLIVAATASVLMSLPLILHGTPDVEQYYRSIYSTISFVRNLVAGADPWYVPSYGFGISLPSSTWLVKFPPAIPAALFGIDTLYGTIWLVGTFVFSWYFLMLSGLLTTSRLVRGILLATALLSYSQLGPSYVDDWPTHFLGWSLLPACLWFTIKTLLQESKAAIVRNAVACALVFQIFATSAQQNQIVTVYLGLCVVLASFVRKRTLATFAVGAAMALALIPALDVLTPTVQGMTQIAVDHGAAPIAFYEWSERGWVRATPPLTSYSAFLEPFWSGFKSPAGTEPATWVRMPFFGLGALLLAVAGAARAFVNRDVVGSLPSDVVRGLAIGFVANSVATLLPAAVLLNVPRMFLFRDGQALFGLLCAVIGMEWMYRRFPRLLQAGVFLHLAQIIVVALPIIWFVAAAREPFPLFAYARRERVLFGQLERAGVHENSRVLLAGELEEAVDDEKLWNSGLTAFTDFSLAGIPIINAAYKGVLTPALGTASRPGRYGSYETIIAWEPDLRQLNAEALDVLGISHVLALENDQDVAGWATQRGLKATHLLAGVPPVRVFHNENAWSRAVLLVPNRINEPPLRPECPTSTIYCRDYSDLVKHPAVPLESDWYGSTMHIKLPPAHSGGTILVSQVLGSSRTASVDGKPREVRLFLDTFGELDVLPGERSVTLSVRRTDRMIFSLTGIFVITSTALLVLILRRRQPA